MNTFTPSQMAKAFAALPTADKQGLLKSVITDLPEDKKVSFVTNVFTKSVRTIEDAFSELDYAGQHNFLQAVPLNNSVNGFSPALKTKLAVNMTAFKGNEYAVNELMNVVINGLDSETDAIKYFISQLRGDRRVYDVVKEVLNHTTANAAHAAREWEQVLQVLEEDHLAKYREKIVECHNQIALKKDQKITAEDMVEQLQNCSKTAQNCVAKGMGTDPVNAHVSKVIESKSDPALAIQDSDNSDAGAPVSADAMALVSVEPQAGGDTKKVDQSKAYTLSGGHWRKQVTLLGHEIEELEAEIKTLLQNIQVIEEVFKGRMQKSFAKSWTDWAQEVSKTLTSPFTGAKRRWDQVCETASGWCGAKKARSDEAE